MDPKDKNTNEKDIDIDSLLSYYNSSEKKAEPGSGIKKSAESVTRSTPQSDSQAPRKKFVVHIDDDDFNYAPSTRVSQDSDKPADNSSIYFSNYKGRNVTVIPTNRPSANKPTVGKQSSTGAKRPASQSTGRTSASKKNAKKTIKSVGSRFAVVLFACILIFTTLASYLSITAINDVLAITQSDDSVPVEIYKKNEKGEDDLTQNLTYDEIIDILAEENLVSRKNFCKLFAKFRHFDNEAYKFKPGAYTFKKSMGVEGMLYKCLQQTKTAETVTVSFPEGWTITQMFQKLETNNVCSAKALYAALDSFAQTHANEYPFLNDVPNDDSRYQNLEGYLFPDTYDFYVESDPNSVIAKMFASFGSHWDAECKAQAEKLGYTMDQIITIASIIQKEAADSTQMKDVSSVIHNRLRNSMNYPSIGCDSTYDYISNYYDAANFGVGQKAYYLNKYATDKNRGLPPGPIANPGLDAIDAALYPSNTNYYFFQHDKRGNIYLASTKSQFDYDYSVVQRINNEN